MRTLPIAAAMLALSACSGEPAETEAPATTAAIEAVATDAAAATASEAPMASAAATDAASAAATPSPTPAPSASASAAPAAKASAAPVAAASPAAVVAAAAPPPSFGRCVACHDAAKGGADKLGPNLYKVYGAKAGVGSYAFSDAMKASGITWNDATLDKWLENPRAMVPGTTMSFPGLKDPAKRAEIIAFLKTAR